ncbi:hypothetical protein AB0N61_10305 [Microbacterium sp. NPDC089320]|uniref:hypothetical protein n=1 Tax=Microbacterium sp. NPDC089320 TaxID=3155182 RepID=UPI003420106F
MNVPLAVQILIAAVPASAAVIAAVIAGRYAGKARLAEQKAARLLALEERTAERKWEVYQPFIQALGDMLTPSRKDAALAAAEDTMGDFQNFVGVWGSDEVVQAFYRFRRAAVTNPPALITMRLVGDLFVAMRKDLAWPESEITALHTIGPRINDLTVGSPLETSLRIPFDELAARENWTPPW